MENKFKYDLKVFGVNPIDYGWIYLIKNGDLYKIGTTKNPDRRLNKDAKTWLPDMVTVAVKPFFNVRQIERHIHTALAGEWYSGEWFKFDIEDFEEFFIESFSEFYDDDPETNSVDFIYWFHGSGFSELTLERSRQGLSLPEFQRQTSYVKKTK